MAQEYQPQLNNHSNIPHRIYMKKAKGYSSHGWVSVVFASSIFAQIWGLKFLIFEAASLTIMAVYGPMVQTTVE